MLKLYAVVDFIDVFFSSADTCNNAIVFCPYSEVEEADLETTLNLNLLSRGLITDGKVTEKCLLVIEVLYVIVLM